MEVTLTRIAKRETYTIGRLAINGTYFCDTLEPTWRDIGVGRPGRKVMGRTAIPEGRYPLVVTFSPRFKRWLPLLLNVPQFSGIRIHSGNTADDSAGCIVVGRNKVKGKVLESQATLRELLVRIGDGRDITIEIL